MRCNAGLCFVLRICRYILIGCVFMSLSLAFSPVFAESIDADLAIITDDALRIEAAHFIIPDQWNVSNGEVVWWDDAPIAYRGIDSPAYLYSELQSDAADALIVHISHLSAIRTSESRHRNDFHCSFCFTAAADWSSAERFATHFIKEVIPRAENLRLDSSTSINLDDSDFLTPQQFDTLKSSFMPIHTRKLTNAQPSFWVASFESASYNSLKYFYTVDGVAYTHRIDFPFVHYEVEPMESYVPQTDYYTAIAFVSNFVAETDSYAQRLPDYISFVRSFELNEQWVQALSDGAQATYNEFLLEMTYPYDIDKIGTLLQKSAKINIPPSGFRYNAENDINGILLRIAESVYDSAMPGAVQAVTLTVSPAYGDFTEMERVETILFADGKALTRHYLLADDSLIDAEVWRISSNDLARIMNLLAVNDFQSLPETIETDILDGSFVYIEVITADGVHRSGGLNPHMQAGLFQDIYAEIISCLDTSRKTDVLVY